MPERKYLAHGDKTCPDCGKDSLEYTGWQHPTVDPLWIVQCKNCEAVHVWNPKRWNNARTEVV
jgi:hypothetical protein